MAKDVFSSFVTVIEEIGGRNRELAEQFMRYLGESGR